MAIVMISAIYRCQPAGSAGIRSGFAAFTLGWLPHLGSRAECRFGDAQSVTEPRKELRELTSIDELAEEYTEQMEQVDGAPIAGFWLPATDVGGDYFDYYFGGHIDIVIADLSGHSVGPSLVMAETRIESRAFVSLPKA